MAVPARRLIPLLVAGGFPLLAQIPSVQAPAALSMSEVTRLGFTVQGAGARATGMGGAFVGVADDATAASFNPAGLAQLRTFEASLVGSRSDFRMSIGSHADPANGATVVSDSYRGHSSFSPRFFSFTAPMTLAGRNLVFQISRQRQFGLDQDYTRNTEEFNPFQSQDSLVTDSATQSGSMEVWSLAAAYELSPRLLAGIAFNEWSGRWDFHGASTYSFQSQFTSRGAEISLNQENRLRGRNNTLGLLWRSDSVRVGIAYQTPFTAKFKYSGWFEGSTDLAGPQIFFPPTPLDAGPGSYDVHWPETLSLGASWRLHPQWMVAADWVRTPWSKARFETNGVPFAGLPFLDPAPGSLYDPAAGNVAQVAKDVVALRAGGEYLAFVGPFLVPVRAGAFREPQPTSDPVTGEQRVLKGFTLGAGLKWKGLALDLAYKQGRSNRQASHPENPSVLTGRTFLPSGTGSESLTVKEFVASVIVQFKGEGLRKAARWLFVGGE